jgi:ketosteroid isomerase-like protein
VLGAALLSGCAAPRAPQSDTDASAGAETSIRTLLADQVAAWNRGDIDGFMEGYWRSPEMRFASGGSVRQGWQAARDAYHAGYPDRAAMGTLSFSDLDVQIVAPGHALAFGRWSLGETTRETSSGLFTLVLRRMPEGWRIVHDHTSAG